MGARHRAVLLQGPAQRKPWAPVKHPQSRSSLAREDRVLREVVLRPVHRRLEQPQQQSPFKQDLVIAVVAEWPRAPQQGQ